MTDDMTRAELALLVSLGAAGMARAGRITAAAEYPQVTEDQLKSIAENLEDLLTDCILMMRAEGPVPTLLDVAAMTDELAAGAVIAVLGEPPGAPANTMH